MVLLVLVARYSAAACLWNRVARVGLTTVAASGVVPVAAIVPVSLAGAFRYNWGITTLPVPPILPTLSRNQTTIINIDTVNRYRHWHRYRCILISVYRCWHIVISVYRYRHKSLSTTPDINVDTDTDIDIPISTHKSSPSPSHHIGDQTSMSTPPDIYIDTNTVSHLHPLTGGPTPMPISTMPTSMAALFTSHGLQHLECSPHPTPLWVF